MTVGQPQAAGAVKHRGFNSAFRHFDDLTSVLLEVQEPPCPAAKVRQTAGAYRVARTSTGAIAIHPEIPSAANEMDAKPPKGII